MTATVTKKRTTKATVSISSVIWDPAIYPRQKWNTSTIERYKDAIEAGEEFPPIVLESGTNRLLDGKHRLEAYKLAGVENVPAEMHDVPEGMTAKYYAAILSARHGDRMSNSDLKALAEEEFEADYQANGDSTLDAQDWGRSLGISKSTVYRWVSHIIERGKASRAAKEGTGQKEDSRYNLLGIAYQKSGKSPVVDGTQVFACPPLLCTHTPL